MEETTMPRFFFYLTDKYRVECHVAQRVYFLLKRAELQVCIKDFLLFLLLLSSSPRLSLCSLFFLSLLFSLLFLIISLLCRVSFPPSTNLFHC